VIVFVTMTTMRRSMIYPATTTDDLPPVEMTKGNE